MSVYPREKKDGTLESPYYWMFLGFDEKTGKPIRESTKIPIAGATKADERRQKVAADQVYRTRMTQLTRITAGLEKPPEAETPPVPRFGVFVDWWLIHDSAQHRGNNQERWRLKMPDAHARAQGATPHPLRAYFNDRPLDAFDWAVVKEYATSRLATTRRNKLGEIHPIKKSTVKREITLLKSVMQGAVESKYLDKSPLEGMPHLDEDPVTRRNITEAEEKRLLPHLRPDDLAIFLIGQESLVRLSDILDLLRTDVDVTKETVFVRYPKTAKPYTTALGPRTLKALAALPAADPAEPYLFPDRRVAQPEHRASGYRTMLEKACDAADVPYGRAVGGITFHWATRRTGASRMSQRGVALKTAMEIGAWKDARTLIGIYQESTTPEAHAAVRLVGPQKKARTARPGQPVRQTRHSHSIHTKSKTRRIPQ